MINLNQRTVNIKLKRIDVCDLLIACLIAEAASKADGGTDCDSNKWSKLHTLLKEQLDNFDKKYEEVSK